MNSMTAFIAAPSYLARSASASRRSSGSGAWMRSPSVEIARSASAGRNPMPVSDVRRRSSSSPAPRGAGTPLPSGARRKRRARELVAKLEEQSLGDLLADARDRGERRQIPLHDRTRQLGGGQRPQDGHGDLRPHVRHADQRPEGAALAFVGESEERQGVFAHVGVHPQRHAPGVVGARSAERA